MPPDARLSDTLLEITSKRLGVTGVVDAEGELLGVITDGDLRRGLERAGDLRALTARELMTHVAEDDPRRRARGRGGRGDGAPRDHRRCSSWPTGRGDRSGVIHLHDLLRAGVV